MKKLMIFVSALLLLAVIPAFAAVNDTGFSDVGADSWYAEAATYCRDNGLMSGITTTTFEPETATSRAMLVTILYRQAGSPNAETVDNENAFLDVTGNSWYSNAVHWANQNTIVSGYGNGYFGTNDYITREQIATILWRNLGSPSANDTPVTFADQDSISTYAVEAVDWARENGIVTGKENNHFDPQGTATRAETATMLYRYLTRDITEPPVEEDPQDGGDDNSALTINITVDTRNFTAVLYDNPSTKALLAQMPMTVRMDELNGNEKYYFMSEGLPTNSQSVGQINNGDIMLYGSDCLVVFYESFSTSYSYTRIGNIEDASGFAAALGNGSVQVTLSSVN